MSPHAAKTAALSAYAAGALSAVGRGRIERHVQRCEGCRSELAAIRLWASESARLRAVRTAPVDFARIERVLAREAQAQGRRVAAERATRRLVPVLGPLGLAAAVLVTLTLERVLDVAPVEAAALPAATIEAVPAALAARVTLLAGAVAVRGGPPLAVGELLAAPAVIDLGSGAVQLAVGEDLAIAAGSESALVLAHSDEERAEIELLRGAVAVGAASTSASSEGTPTGGFEVAERVVVLAAGYAVAARVAVFEVEFPQDGSAPVAVSVRAGEVRVTGRGEAVDLTAPVRFVAPGRLEPLADEPRVPEAALAGRRAGQPVRVERPGTVRWGFPDGSVIDGSSVALLAEPGVLDLVAFDRFGRPTSLSVRVGEAGFVPAGTPMEPTGPRFTGYLAPEVLAAAVDRSRLTRCYNHALRLHPDLGAARLRLRVTLSAHGDVMRTRLEGTAVPPSLEACVAEETAHWDFPSPGGPLSFVVPLTFRTDPEP